MHITETLRAMHVGDTVTALAKRVEVAAYDRDVARADISRTLNSWSPTATREAGKFVVERFECVNYSGAIVYGVTVTRTA